jgi:hypothetical protein
MKESRLGDFLFYQSSNGNTSIQIVVGDDTVWATQASIADIFETDISGISRHIQNIFEIGEVGIESNLQKMQIANSTKPVNFYSLDVIISVGYRVNSIKATEFRIWANSILKEYLIKGFVLDDERLKQGQTLFGKDYFDELLERIRKIRASERRFYQKITDIYAQCSMDYDSKSPITKTFFATVQNKLEFAITHLTAPEIIKSRADSTKPFMNLKSFKNQNKDGIVLKSDVTTAKNYLNEKELGELNTIVSMYLDYAELQARKNKLMKMSDWVVKLDSFLKFNEYDILNNAGKIKKEVADKFAEKEYEKFRIIQDREYKSDFDKVVDEIKTTGKIPDRKVFSIKVTLKENEGNLSDFNKSLKKAIDFNPKE